MQRLCPGGRGALARCWVNVGPALRAFGRHWNDIGLTFRVCCVLCLSDKHDTLALWAMLDSTTMVQRWPNFWSEFRVFAIRQCYSISRGSCLATARCWPGIGSGWANTLLLFYFRTNISLFMDTIYLHRPMLKLIYKPQVGLGAWMIEIVLMKSECISTYQYNKRLPLMLMGIALYHVAKWKVLRSDLSSRKCNRRCDLLSIVN